MNLGHYIEGLHRELIAAAEAGGDEARTLAERLTGPLESASRLMLLDALSAAASEITAELAPGSVDVRLRGRDPEFVVVSPAVTQALDDVTEAAPEPGPLPADDNNARLTLRLPEQLKSRIEDAATRDGLSVNAWMVRALGAALEPGADRGARRRGPPGGQRYTGWVR